MRTIIFFQGAAKAREGRRKGKGAEVGGVLEKYQNYSVF